MMQRSISSNRASRWLHLLTVLLILKASLATKAVLTIVDFARWSYRAEISQYGKPLNTSSVYAASLMTPPDDPQLCEFPFSLLDNENKTTRVELRTAVGLLVSLGGCEPHKKAQVALEIQQNVTTALKYIVFYNNDPNKPDEIASLKEADFENVTESIQSVALISVSTVSGTGMLARIEQLSVATNTSPEFLSEDNRRWHLPMVLERVTEDSYNRGGEYKKPRGTAENFYWFRLVLFTLLILSPCCRAGYLWWAGGGRIQLRRNGNGYIIGLQYIPPMSYWFAAGAQETGPPITDRLTEEEVMALPEIIYCPPPSEGNDTEKSFSDSEAENWDDVEILVSSGSADDDQDDPIENSISTANSDEEQPAERTLDSENYATTCTTCSICIDEFEGGERIRLLPRCRHAFHTECIMPWLVERQGCCPLCKSSVLGPEGGDETSDEEPSDDLFDEDTDANTHVVEMEPSSQADGEDADANPVSACQAETSALVEDSSVDVVVAVSLEEGPAGGAGQSVQSKPAEQQSAEQENADEQTEKTSSTESALVPDAQS